MKISTVLLTYDFNQSLAELSKTAIESVRFSVPDMEMVIVDNASSFGSAFSRSEADIYIRNKINVGYPAAVNQGMALSHGEFVAISNNDIKVTPNWWQVSEEIFSNPKVGTVHFRMVSYNEQTVLGNDVKLTGGERWCTSSFFVIRRKAFQGYDENYGAGGYDDYDHHHRMRDIEGWHQVYTNKAAYYHMDSITYRTMEQQAARDERDRKNKEYYKSKFGEYPDEQFARLFADQMHLPWKPQP